MERKNRNNAVLEGWPAVRDKIERVPTVRTMGFVETA